MQRREGEHPFGDMGQLICLALFLAVWIGDSFFLRVSTFLSDVVPVYIRIVVLAASLVLAACLGGSGHRVVDPDRRTAGVVKTGAFRYVRHPLYLASILAFLGVALATASLLSLATCGGIAVFYDYIASYEEKLLLEKCGEEYSAYRRETGKWLPKIRRAVRDAKTRKPTG